MNSLAVKKILRIEKCYLIPWRTICSQQIWRKKDWLSGNTRKLLHFLAYSVNKVSDVWNFFQNFVIERCSAIVKLLIETSRWEMQRSFRKTLFWISRHFVWLCYYWHFRPIKFALPVNKRNSWHCSVFLKVIKSRLIPYWMKDNDWFLKEAGWFFAKKSHHSQILAMYVHIVCNAITISKNVIMERCSADKIFSTETMIAECQEKVWKNRLIIETAHTQMHFLTTSPDQFSDPRNQTQNWTVGYHFFRKQNVDYVG